MAELKLFSQNVRGLSDSSKRRKIFHWLNDKDVNVILLQETHSTKETEHLWRSEWGGSILFSHGKSNARGVCILLKNNINYNLINTISDDEGRYLILDIEFGDVKMSLTNVYGPNTDSATFFISLIENIEKIENDNRIIGGDFNFVLDIEIDKKGGINKTNVHAQTVVQTYIEETELVDIWRFHHPEKKQYTWNRKKPSIVQCRLDFFLCSFGLVDSVKKSNIGAGFLSDHSNISLSLYTSKNKRGRGFWKLNCSLLNNLDYVKLIKETIIETVQYNKDTEPSLLWDTIKCQIRGASIKFSSTLKKNRNNLIEILEKKLNALEEKYAENNCPSIENDISKVKEDLHKEVDRKTKGAIIRCRIRWHEEGEKNSNYFINLEKRNFNNKTINRLINDEGIILDKQNEILEETCSFYKDLYTSKTVKEPILENIGGFKIDIPKLSFEDSEILDIPLEASEILNALKSTQNNKSPGIDGLPADFYKVFWTDIKDHIMEAFKAAFSNGLLSITQRRGQICLLPKKSKDPLRIKNWRPISLLNQDYKLLAKTIASRIKSVLTKIIDPDQTGFIKGRYIGENIIRTLDLLAFAEKENIPGLLISIDFEKAFDCLEWKFIEKALISFNFPDSIRKWIKILYTDISSCISNNGWASSFFNITRGVRQGCPLSPYLFIICSEILALAVRQNKDIKGFDINGKHFKIHQYADDTCITTPFCNNSFLAIFKTFERFKEISGLCVNYDKTEILRIGSLRNSEARFYTEKKINWTNGVITLLGIKICTNMNEITSQNILPIINKIKDMVDTWSKRKLTLYGKITIIKSLLISQLVYHLSVLPNPEQVLLKTIDKILFNYLWDNKPHRICKNTIVASKELGGLKMVSVFDKCIALKIAWVKRLFCIDEEYQQSWRNLAINSFVLDNNLMFKGNISETDANQVMVKKCNQFWKDVMLAWCKFNFHDNVTDINICHEQIWFNSHIKINGKLCFNKTMYEAGIVNIKDLCRNDGTIMKQEEIERLFDIKVNFLTYAGLINAIPKTWKTIMKNLTLTDTPRSTFNNVITAPSPSGWIYTNLVDNKVKFPEVARKKWSETLNTEISREEFLDYFITINKTTIYTKLRNFQFRLLHGILVTNIDRHKWGKLETDLCTFCQSEKESIVHILWQCNIVKLLWFRVIRWIHELSGIMINVSMKEILLGLQSTDCFFNMLNSVFLIVKQYVYASKCLQNKPCFAQCKSVIIRNIETEKGIAEKNGKIQYHNTKWQCLLNN